MSPRKPTVDDLDDTDDEDGIVTDDKQQDRDLKLRPVTPTRLTSAAPATRMTGRRTATPPATGASPRC